MVQIPRRWLVVLLAFVASVALSAQALSPQVLQLLTRANSWAGQQTFANLRVTKAAIPSDTTSRLYADTTGNLYWDGGVIAGSSSVNAHNLLSSLHSDTVAASVVRGDLLVGNSTPKWVRLARGTANQVLTSDGTDLTWSGNYARLDASQTFSNASGQVFQGNIVVQHATSPFIDIYKTDATAARFRQQLVGGNYNVYDITNSVSVLTIQNTTGNVLIGPTAVTADDGLAIRARAVGSGLTLRESYAGNNVLFNISQNNGDGAGATMTLGDGVGNNTLTLKSDPGDALKLYFNVGNVNAQYMQFTNTGGSAYIGQEGSAGGAIVTGASPYALVLAAPGTTRSLQLGTNNTVRQTIDANGTFTFNGLLNLGASGSLANVTIGNFPGVGTIAGSMPSGAVQLYSINNSSATGTLYDHVFALNSSASATALFAAVGYIYNTPSGTTGVVEGLRGVAEHGGSGTITTLQGTASVVQWSSTGGGTDAMAFVAGMTGRSASSGTYTNGYGFYVGTFGAGMTNKYSLYSSDSTAVLSNAGSATIGGTLTLGSGSVQLTTAGGKIQAISSTYFASLDGSTLTGLSFSTNKIPALSSTYLTSLSGANLTGLDFSTNKIPAINSTYFASLDGSALTNISTGSVTGLNNNVFLTGKDTGAAAHNMIGVNASDTITIGDATLKTRIYGGTNGVIDMTATDLEISYGSVVFSFDVNGVNMFKRMTIASGALNITGGSGSAALGANSPAVTNTAPYVWFKFVSSDGSTVYIPAWK